MQDLLSLPVAYLVAEMWRERGLEGKEVHGKGLSCRYGMKCQRKGFVLHRIVDRKIKVNHFRFHVSPRHWLSL